VGDAAPSTVLHPTPDVALVAGQSAVWCATMQMAWDRLTGINDRPLLVASADPQAVSIAAGRFDEDWVDRDSVVTTAGILSPEDTERVRDEVTRRFGGEPALPTGGGGAAAPRAVPTATAFAMLSKSLTFEHPLTARDQGLQFTADGAAAESVAAFVARRDDAADSKKTTDQIDVLWCAPSADASGGGKADVVVELKTTSSDERLILSRLSRPATLRSAIDTTLARARTPNTRVVREAEIRQRRGGVDRVPEADRPALIEESAGLMRSSRRMLFGEEFAAPVISINAAARYPGLEGRVIGRKSKIEFVSRAEQVVRFRLDETGARLQSESLAQGVLASKSVRSLRFDEPFLLLLIKGDAPWPYLAIWVGATDVLEKGAATPARSPATPPVPPRGPGPERKE
jgi:hypothetical protein